MATRPTRRAQPAKQLKPGRDLGIIHVKDRHPCQCRVAKKCAAYRRMRIIRLRAQVIFFLILSLS